MEPKISDNNANEVCQRLGFDGWIRVEVEYMKGSIWVLWKKNHYCITQLKLASNFIHLEVTQNNKAIWFLIAVYCNPNEGIGDKFWEDITDISRSIASPRLILGDFNAIKSISKCSKNEGSSRLRFLFGNWINSLGLINIGLQDHHTLGLGGSITLLIYKGD